MIRLNNVEVFNLGGAIRGMRNPLNSHGAADSGHSWDDAMEELDWRMGVNDLTLAKKLVAAGTEHRKFMRQIFVSMDITAPLYWWKEMDTYKVGTVANSESTMHTLSKNPITRECFSFDKFNEEPQWCGMGLASEPDIEFIQNEIIGYCEFLRQKFLDTKDKQYWRALIQLLPESWNQTRTWTGNYEVLANIVTQRKTHKLQEWVDFCEVVCFDCAYLKELIGYIK